MPRLFVDSSDVESPETASFVVLISEKLTRKRSVAKSDAQNQRLKKVALLKRDAPNN